MTTRKPDFYVVKRTYLGKPEYWSEEFERWFSSKSDRTNYENVACAENDALGMDGARVVPVFCTTRQVEPKMRERSCAWVLKRLAEGRTVQVHTVLNPIRDGYLSPIIDDNLYQADFTNGRIRVMDVRRTEWVISNNGFTRNGKVMCRIAKLEEVPT